MLLARAILSRRIVTRSSTTPSVRHNTTRPTKTEENDTVIQESSDRGPGHLKTPEHHAPPIHHPLSTVSTPYSGPHETPITNPSSSDSSSSDKPISWNGLPAYDLQKVKQRIRERTDQAVIAFRERADDFTNHTKSTFSQLGAHLNKVTGYEEIEALKKEVTEQEERIKDTRQAAKQAKIAYEQAVIQRSTSQREVNDLMQRKSLWTEGDLSRFTVIVRQDQMYEQEEIRAKTVLDETEAAVEKEFTALMKSILARYHEEQVWSDKIRSASTYGSLAVLGLNLVVFLLAIVVVEPWKRRRLAQTFEAKIEELSAENLARLEANAREIGEKFVEQENLLSRVLEEVHELKGTRTVMAVMGGDGDSPTQLQLVESPVSVERPAVVSIPGVPLTLSQRTFELVAVGLGAFVLGMMGTILLD